MVLQKQIETVLSENVALKGYIGKLEAALTEKALPELKEMQLISLGAQAEIHEQLQDNMLILFQAVAEIYESIADGGVEE